MLQFSLLVMTFDRETSTVNPEIIESVYNISNLSILAPENNTFSDISYVSFFNSPTSLVLCDRDFEWQSVFAPDQHSIVVDFVGFDEFSHGLAIYGSRYSSRNHLNGTALISESTLPNKLISYWPYLWVISTDGGMCSSTSLEIVVSVWNTTGRLNILYLYSCNALFLLTCVSRSVRAFLLLLEGNMTLCNKP